MSAAGGLAVDVTLDFGALLRSAAEAQGYLSPADADEMRRRLVAAEVALDTVRHDSPGLRGDVDDAIRALNAGDHAAARAAFAEANAALDARDAAQRLERARLKYSEATLLYPFEASRAEPLLNEAAELAQADPLYWIECGRARVSLGSLDQALAAFAAAERIVRVQSRSRDLAAVMSDIGDVRVDQGDLPGALTAYEESLGIARNLAARNPGDAGSARDVSVSLEKLGDVRVAQGDLPGALAAHDESLGIARDLAARDPGDAGWARDVSVSLERLGDVRVALGDLPGALAAYDESLGIRRDLAARDPGNAGWARDVSVSLNKLGDVSVAQGDLPGALAAYGASLGIARNLAARDPGNAGWARDVSVSLDKIGDLRVAQGDLPGALAAYEESFGIRRDLAARDPGNAGWARDVSVSLSNLGDLRVALGDLPGALAAYEEDLDIARALAARDPGNAGWARDVWVSYWNLATNDPDNAVAHWSEVVARMEDMAARGVLLPTDAPHLETARRNLAEASTKR